MGIIIGIVKLALWAAVVMGGLAVAGMVFGMAFLAQRAIGGGRGPQCHRGSWKRVLVPLAIVLLAYWFMTRSSRSPEWSPPASVASQAKEGVQAGLRAAQRAAEHHERRIPPRPKSMQELWEELNRPRIDLSAREPEEAESRPAPYQWSKEVARRTTEQLEEVTTQVSTTARRAADVGTIIGQTLVALQRVSDSPATDAAPAADVKRTSTVVAAPAGVAVDVSVPQPLRPDQRPDWIDDPPKRVGNVWRQIIVAGDYATREECNEEADRLLIRATAEHLADLTGIPQFQQVAPESDAWALRLREAGVGLDYIRREIAKDEFEETVNLSVGPMKRLYTLVEFSPSVDAELRQRWQQNVQQRRLGQVGFGAGSVLALLGLVYSLMKVDTWTKGYYTKRLFLGVPAAIIGIVLLLTWTEVIF